MEGIEQKKIALKASIRSLENEILEEFGANPDSWKMSDVRADYYYEEEQRLKRLKQQLEQLEK